MERMNLRDLDANMDDMDEAGDNEEGDLEMEGLTGEFDEDGDDSRDEPTPAQGNEHH